MREIALRVILGDRKAGDIYNSRVRFGKSEVEESIIVMRGAACATRAIWNCVMTGSNGSALERLDLGLLCICEIT